MLKGDFVCEVFEGSFLTPSVMLSTVLTVVDVVVRVAEDAALRSLAFGASPELFCGTDGNNSQATGGNGSRNAFILRKMTTQSSSNAREFKG